MPISNFRRVTAKAIKPYRPMEASSAAAAANDIESQAKKAIHGLRLVDLHVEVSEFGCWDGGIDLGDGSFDRTGCSERIPDGADVEGQIGKDGARILQRADVGIRLNLLTQIGLFAGSARPYR